MENTELIVTDTISIVTEERLKMNEYYENDEIEIDLRVLFHTLLRRWWLILLCGILGGAAALGISVGLITPQYRSTSLLYILSKTTSVTSMADLQIGGELAEDFIVIAKSRPVIDGAIKRIQEKEGKTFTRKQIQSMLTVTDQATRILAISATSANPMDASIVANAIAEETVEQMAQITKTDPPSIMERAEVETSPVSPGVKKNTVIGILLGALLSLSILVIQFMLNDHIKTEEDVAKYLRLSTLAVIPTDRRREQHNMKAVKKSEKNK